MPNSNTLTITQLNVQAIRLPLKKPYRTAGGTVTLVPLILIELHTARGVTGRSVLFAYNDLALTPLLTLLRDMSPPSPVSAATYEKQLDQKCRLIGKQGLIGMALAAIDMALWDALAKRHDCTLIELLGGEHHRIPAYASIGFEGVRGCADSAAQLAAEGFHGIKVCLGYQSAQEDLNVIRAMRNAVGSDVELMVDYNQCLNIREAKERLKQLQDCNLCWVEEPLPADDFDSLARLRAQTEIPLQAGENWWGHHDVEHAIHYEASDYVMLSLMKCGGISGWLKAAEVARSQCIPLSSNFWPETSAQLLSLSATAHWLQYSDWWRCLMSHPLQLEQGCSLPPSAPGAGMDWDPAIAEYYRVKA